MAATKSRPREDIATLSRKILDAALMEFAERGYHGTNIPSVMERADVSASTLYRLFASKEVLVNALYRDAKGRLEHALAHGVELARSPRELFREFWRRLGGFARREPLAFRFLEMQDHVPYLDAESRARELAVLAPIYVVVLDFQRRGIWRADVAPETIIAFVWGAFVGLGKADRLGYVRLTEAMLDDARDASWRAFAVAETTKDVMHANDAKRKVAGSRISSRARSRQPGRAR